MIMFDILVYTIFATLGAMIADAAESKFGQHLGMGAFAAVLAGYVFGWLVNLLFEDLEGIVWLVLNWMVYSALLAVTCFLASFIVYTVNRKQALVIGITLGIGHIAYRLFWLWAWS